MDDNQPGVASLPSYQSGSPGWWTIVLVAAGALALLVDLPLARWFAAPGLPGFVDKLAKLAEVFGHGLGVAVIVLVVAVLDPRRRLCVPRILAASLGSGLFSNVFKLLVARTRPHHADLAGSVFHTFTDWLPLASAGSAKQGFPSSHTATAAGLAVALVWLYPRGTWLFPSLAALVALQRMATGGHFLSDTLWGAAAGLLFAHACLPGGMLARIFDRLECLSMRKSHAIRDRQPADSRAA